MRRDTAVHISVVTPTHNRRPSVFRLLEGLSRGSTPATAFEVVVVADGCTDDTVSALSSYQAPFSLTVLEQAPARGAAAARNLGARAARGGILLFIDDDIEPLPTLIAEHLVRHGPDLDRPDHDPVVVVGAPLPVRDREPDLHRIALWGWWERQFEQMARAGHRFTYDEVFGGVFSVRASVFHRLGGFDEALACREDPELGLRLIRAGARVMFAREAGGYHHEMRSRTGLLSRKKAEGRADLRLAERYPELWPRLRLSTDEDRRELRFLRRMALDFPRVGDALLAVSTAALDVLQRVRFRGTWRRLHAATMYYGYWRGVGLALGGRDDSRRILANLSARGAAAASGARETEIDLAEGLGAAEERLDRERPDRVLVRFGDIEVGLIPAVPGAEPLRGSHLRRQLADWLGDPLCYALARVDLQAGSGRAAAGRRESLPTSHVVDREGYELPAVRLFEPRGGARP